MNEGNIIRGSAMGLGHGPLPWTAIESNQDQSLMPLIQVLPRPIEAVVDLGTATFPSLAALISHTQQGIAQMRQIQRSFIIITLAVGLAACGNTTGDRALSGGGLGAAGGAAIGALTGTSVLGGAALGGAAGAATGALTSPNTVNLGRPAWR